MGERVTMTVIVDVDVSMGGAVVWFSLVVAGWIVLGWIWLSVMVVVFWFVCVECGITTTAEEVKSGNVTEVTFA